MTITEILSELDEMHGRAADASRESTAIAMNSYGAGYDAGYFMAVCVVRELFGEIRAELSLSTSTRER